MRRYLLTALLFGTLLWPSMLAQADDGLQLELRDQIESRIHSGQWEMRVRNETWKPSETAIIVCDVWDLHHCLNAVRRMEQFVPRLNEVLTEARSQGVTIIHAPSDCMPAYQDHPARRRAEGAPRAASLPPDVTSWCSVIPAEERADYPLDQSDGGEDDDPVEHRAWAAKLEALGRNPGTPWKSQHDGITIDAAQDFISDRGDEVWNVLEQRGIRNVILTGVHLNMCVLGRPFGLRQMARNGKHVVLMRDLTDTMYNPQRWPYVAHQRGTELMVSHVERYVCPTITSNQILGGKPFQLVAVSQAPEKVVASEQSVDESQTRWVVRQVPAVASERSQKGSQGWYRCVVQVPEAWLSHPLKLHLDDHAQSAGDRAWLNGEPLRRSKDDAAVFVIPKGVVAVNDFNLLVVHAPEMGLAALSAPLLRAGEREWKLAGRWQFRQGDNESFSTMPLPAKFGGSADIVFTPPDPLFVARAVTRTGDFTTGIEGPASDRAGNVYAVNFAKQGTIGRVTPDGAAEVLVELPAGSIGNGIRIDQDGFLYVADYTQHNILKVDPRTRAVEVFAHNSEMHQPNDLTIAADGTLYASDPDWSHGTGQVWRIDRDGTTTRVATDMGTTNGIELSPDGRTLYVNESQQRRIWAFTVTADGSLSEKRLIRKFDDFGFDGMRCDVRGNLYVTRYGKGTVVKLSPQGEILREISIPGKRPSNICFGGPDGRTAYVTEVEFRRMIVFRVDE